MHFVSEAMGREVFDDLDDLAIEHRLILVALVTYETYWDDFLVDDLVGDELADHKKAMIYFSSLR